MSSERTTTRPYEEPSSLNLDSFWKLVGDEDTATEVQTRAATPKTRPVDAPQIEGYSDFRFLAAGGQGAVFVAHQASTNRKVAVKLLMHREAAHDSTRQRFEREIQITGQLKHPNIVSILHAGDTPDGRRYYVMDYVEGTPLGDYIRTQMLGVRPTIALLARICEAIAYAHRMGVIHRDLKPGNILVDRLGQPHILDFGLARTNIASQQLTLTKAIMGTLPYMSPEQTLGDQHLVDTRSDVYSLGIIIYRLLTGMYPYPVDGDPALVLRNIREYHPDPPTRCWWHGSGVRVKSTWRLFRRETTINNELQTIILRALAKEPDRRYQSAAALGEDLRRYLRGEAIEAKRDSFFYVASKLVRQNLIKSTVVIAVLAILLSAVFISGTFLSLARQEAQTADQQAMTIARESRQLPDLKRLAVPWMLRTLIMEYRLGNLKAATQIYSWLEPNSVEQKAASYLLTPQAPEPDQLRADLGHSGAVLAEIVIAERARAAGDFTRAQAAYATGLKLQPSLVLQSLFESGQSELETLSAGNRP